MAIKLKPGETYAPTNNQGLDLTGSDFYAVIDDIRYDKKSKQCYFSVDIYADATARSKNKAAVDRVNFSFNGDDFDTTIGNDGINVPGAYALVSVDAQFANWESDE